MLTDSRILPAGTARGNELADVRGQALSHIVHYPALGGLVYDLYHDPNEIRGLLLTDTRALRDPGDEILSAEPFPGAGTGEDLRPPQVLADLMRELGGKVVRQPLRDTFGERFQSRPGGPLRIAPAGQPGTALYLSDKLIVLHTNRSPRAADAETHLRD